MPAKVTDHATDVREVDRWEGGVGWMAHPTEIMRRTSHALATDEGVLIVDPVDADGVDDLVAEFGDPEGVVTLVNYHKRDADEVARRHGVPIYLPEPMDGIASELEASTEPVGLGETLGGYELVEVYDGTILGQEVYEYALYNGTTLRIGCTIGGAPFQRVKNERLGMALVRRHDPNPDALNHVEPERVLSGHGAGVHENAADALSQALASARERYLRALLENGVSQFRVTLAAART